MRNRLAGWKTKSLSIAGRVVLAKAFLEGIPFHVMNYIKHIGKITKAIDKITKDFVWGTSEEKK